MEIQLLASDLTHKGESLLKSVDLRAAAGLHTGSGISMNPKLWPCEDSAAALRRPDGTYLAAVADAHWGGSSSETVARELSATFEAAQGKAPQQRLHAALLALEFKHQSTRSPEDPSETTALLVHLEGHTLSYVSVGDSYLIVVTPQSRSFQLKNTLMPFYMGVHPLAAIPNHDPVNTGTVQVSPGDLVLLATDGLEPQACQLEPPDVVRELTGEGTLEERVGRLLESASSAERQAGRDNLALVVIEVL